MSFFKKLTDTAKSTANTLSSKSQELYTTGRLKIEQTQIEGSSSHCHGRIRPSSLRLPVLTVPGVERW